MEKVIFKRAALSAAVVAALVAPGMAFAAQDMMSPTYGKSYEAFADDAKLSGGVFYFQRERDRKQAQDAHYNDKGEYVPAQDGKYHSNLSHSTAQLALNFNSGYAWDVVGIDIGGFGAANLAVDESNGVNEENEFSFWGNSWGAGGDGLSENGASLSTAALKLKFMDGAVTAKGGFTQLNVPGILGVNWSYQPGTYRGGQIEGNFGGLYLTYAIADEYKAPWFRNTNGFSKSNPYASDSYSDANQIDYIHGLAARYTFENGTAVTGSYGQSEGYMDSYHFKLAQKFDVLGGLNTSYQFYGSDTDNNDYDGLAWQQALTAGWAIGPYGFRIEGLWTKAEGDLGNYLPRLTRGYGNSQGANEIWWDSRSDWNHNNEKALFAGVNRSLDDLVGAPGWSVGVSGAYGWDAENGDGTRTDGTEWAANFDVMYTVQDGKLKGTLFKLHYTDYNNEQDDKGSWYYPNMFSS
ncbi:TPA: OprD family outer membrane porin, partial [Aeromonas salmonicida]|nr:OprD family outer membrane porin [Aeromonas salmonicida subsp. salmonicida]ELT1964063.1 OprD family outer membrane porin [Aeromonas salmonicida]ELI6416769.1 OprD family outer membrane porin [Aeromonas salmonicida subsp. salmonicida]ELI6434458.1 OprD family outer membrane porin [Aeromonas salmonicida subsp. salmonicida]ELI6438412.1 OprD family outer membrane porin [Aeromonas salmonicida subsp. salmonicida]